MPSGLLTTASASSPSPPPLLLLSLQSLSLRTLLVVATAAATATAAAASTAPSSQNAFARRWSNPLGIDLNPAPSPEDGPAGARYAIRNPAYLPAQISGIVGSYAFSLVLVAITLLALSKRRRERLRAADDFDLWEEPHFGFDCPADDDAAFRSQNQLQFDGYPFHLAHDLPKSPGHVRNFSLPSPTSLSFQIPQEAYSASAAASYVFPSPTSTTRGQPGVDPDVDQTIVKRDRAMAQAQLEDMYKYVMEQEEAKEAGVEFKAPQLPAPAPVQRRESNTSTLKKGRSKPANLDLNKGEKPQSRTSSFLSALKSPLKKKQMQGINISSPIMTPMSGTFPPQYTGEEMNAIPPRQYAPAKPPPVPSTHLASFSEHQRTGHGAPMTPPDLSPESTQSIDERLRAMTTGGGGGGGGKGKEKGLDGEDGAYDYEEEEEYDGYHHNTHHDHQWHARHMSTATTEADPVSAVSETSQTPLVRTAHAAAAAAAAVRTSGLPSSPKPGVNRFPSLPSSPKPGATFSRPNAPSAVRTGGALPLRAYEPALMSPNTYDRTVKQTVFERANGPKTPGLGTARTPLTGNPVPYSPYQPYTPVVPITPSLVTKADRKRMKRFEARTPTLEMVRSDDEIW